MGKTVDAEPIVGRRVSPARAFAASEVCDAKSPFPSRMKEEGHKTCGQTLKPSLIASDDFGSSDSRAHEGHVESGLFEGVFVDGHDGPFTDAVFEKSASRVLSDKGRIIAFKWITGGEGRNEDVTAGGVAFR